MDYFVLIGLYWYFYIDYLYWLFFIDCFKSSIVYGLICFDWFILIIWYWLFDIDYLILIIWYWLFDIDYLILIIWYWHMYIILIFDCFVDRFYWDSWDPHNIAEGLFAVANVISFTRFSSIFPANELFGPMQISVAQMITVGGFPFLSLTLLHTCKKDLNEWCIFYFFIFF